VTWNPSTPSRKVACGSECGLEEKCRRKWCHGKAADVEVGRLESWRPDVCAKPKRKMDPALAKMLARKKLQQEEAEEEEWTPTKPTEPTREHEAVKSAAAQRRVPVPQMPNFAHESTAVTMDENDPEANIINDAIQLQVDSEDEDVPAVEIASSHSMPAFRDPFEEFHQSSASSQISVPLHSQDPTPAAVPEQSTAANLARNHFDDTQQNSGMQSMSTESMNVHIAQGSMLSSESVRQGSLADSRHEAAPVLPSAWGNGRERPEETYTKISNSKGNVPVLVIATPGEAGGNWRQGAQDASSAYNGLVKANSNASAGGSALAGTNRPAKPEKQDALLKTMAKKNSKILSSLSPRNLGAGSIWDDAEAPANHDEEDGTRGRSTTSRGGPRNQSNSPKAKKKHANRSTSVPANSRASLLDNNILALSTGTIAERSQAARRICSRATTVAEVCFRLFVVAYLLASFCAAA